MENPQCNVVDTGTLVNIRKINAIILDLCRLPVSPCTSGYAAELGRVRGGGGLGRRMAACSSKGQWRAFLRDLLVERGLSLTNREAWTGLNTEFGVDVASSDRQWVRDALKELTPAAASRVDPLPAYATIMLYRNEVDRPFSGVHLYVYAPYMYICIYINACMCV